MVIFPLINHSGFQCTVLRAQMLALVYRCVWLVRSMFTRQRISHEKCPLVWIPSKWSRVVEPVRTRSVFIKHCISCFVLANTSLTYLLTVLSLGTWGSWPEYLWNSLGISYMLHSFLSIYIISSLKGLNPTHCWSLKLIDAAYLVSDVWSQGLYSPPV